MAQSKLTADNILAIVSALALRSGKDFDDCMRAIVHLLPRRMAEPYTEQMTKAASEDGDDENLNALSVTQLKSVCRARNLKGFMKLTKDQLVTFVQSGGVERPKAGTTKSDLSQRRDEIMTRVIPLFGTEEFQSSVEDWDIFTARNLQAIARSNEHFMKGERSRLVAIKRQNLLREMLHWRKPDEEKEDEPASPPRVRRTSSDWGHRTGASPARSKSRSRTPQRKKKTK
jgi:hypothetical protein